MVRKADQLGEATGRSSRGVWCWVVRNQTFSLWATGMVDRDSAIPWRWDGMWDVWGGVDEMDGMDGTDG